MFGHVFIVKMVLILLCINNDYNVIKFQHNACDNYKN